MHVINNYAQLGRISDFPACRYLLSHILPLFSQYLICIKRPVLKYLRLNCNLTVAPTLVNVTGQHW